MERGRVGLRRDHYVAVVDVRIRVAPVPRDVVVLLGVAERVKRLGGYSILSLAHESCIVQQQPSSRIMQTDFVKGEGAK